MPDYGIRATQYKYQVVPDHSRVLGAIAGLDPSKPSNSVSSPGNMPLGVVARVRATIDTLWRQLTSRHLGRSELEAMLHVGGASGKEW